MARLRNKLTARQVSTLKKPGTYSDGGGLYLRIGKVPTHRSWIAIYQFAGRRREMGLGSADDVALAKVREKAAAIRAHVADGIDPLELRRTDRAIPTFGALADAWIEAQTAGVRSDKSVARWKRAVSAGGYADRLRGQRVDGVTTDDVVALLEPIWRTKPETAKYVRTTVESVLGLAGARKHRVGENPARWKGHLEHYLSRPSGKSSGHAAVPWNEMPAFMATVRAKPPSTSALALQLVILTAGRTSEVLKATGGEFDLDAKVWTVPAERMKGGLSHQVPLSDAAIAIVQPLITAPDAFVFRSKAKAGAALSNMALLKFMKGELGRTETVHGMRSAFRDWAGDATDYPRELAEMALAHAVGDATELAYRRGRALARRRALMNDWADFLAKRPLPCPATTTKIWRIKDKGKGLNTGSDGAKNTIDGAGYQG